MLQALFGLREDLDLLRGSRYSFSASIFYLGFIVGAYPAMVLAQRYPIERVASGIVTLWGICLILTVVCTGYKTLYVQRFFLGLLESGISPMFMLIVGSFYKKNEQAMRMGIWYSCTGYVSVFSPRQLWPRSHQWRQIVLEIHTPSAREGFNERERYILVARLRSNNSGVRNTHLKVSQIWELLVDCKFWVVFAIAFLSMIANGPISTFVPIIINGFGFSTVNSPTHLDARWRLCRHSHALFAAQLGTTFAALLLWKLPQSATGGLLFACYILPSVGGGYAVLMGQQIANTAGYTKRSVASSGLYIGYCLGNFVGPLVFKKEDAPRYTSGFIVVVVTALAAAVLAIVYRFLCVWSNRKRDAAGVMEGFDHAYDDDLTDKKASLEVFIPYRSRLTSQNMQFRYIL
ncbi:hypothetical protein NW754_009546 [Fusarium falciforme]|nr:hypothetical protein NW754_009546 [Fusarium falciforme]